MFLKLKRLLLFIVFLGILSLVQMHAYAFSYVYIQGDKQTPFYVKLEGEMQPRYGKNYCIIPQLAPGTLQIEILFQQNEYPAEKFTIKVPANGYRGFMLTMKDGAYALYDLQQRFYLARENNIEDDVMPVSKPVASIVQPAQPSNTAKPVIKKTPTNTAKPVKKSPEPEPVSNKNDPRFMDNIELNNERTFQNEPINKEAISAGVSSEPIIE